MATNTRHSPERLDLESHEHGLIVSEHLARYLWAASLADGRKVLDAGCGTGYGLPLLQQGGALEVTGVDISVDAVEHAAQSVTGAGTAIEVCQGDLRALALPDAAFGLVVCFEVIEHVEAPEEVLDELARVLRPDGLLCISTPNRHVYPPGNPHHIHEYTPDEFARALTDRFEHVRLYRQTAWLSSAILSSDEFAVRGTDGRIAPLVVKTESTASDEETFTIALAGQREPPSVDSLLTLGAPFEVRWWESQMQAANVEREEHRRRARRHEDVERERLEQGRALLALDAELATAQNRMAQLEVAHAEVQAWADAQLQERNEMDDEFRSELRLVEDRLRRAEGTIDDITGSLSWRLTSPVRRAKRLLSRG